MLRIATLDLRSTPMRVALLVALLLLLRTSVAVATGDGIGWDFSDNYYRVGFEIYHGHPENLYNVDPYRGYAGAPITAFVFAPLGPWPARIAVSEFKLMCATCFAVGFWLLYPLFSAAARPRLGPWTTTVYLAAILLFEPVWFVFTVGGQATALCFPLLIWFLRAFLRKRSLQAAVALSVAVLLKPFLAPMMLIFFFAGEWSLIAAMAGVLGVEAVLSIAVMGLDVHRAWITTLRSITLISVQAWWNNISLWNVPDSIWVTTVLHQLAPENLVESGWKGYMTVARFVLIAVFAVLAVLARRSAADTPHRRKLVFDLAILFCMFQSLTIWPHYMVFLFPTLALAVFRLAPSVPAAAWLSALALASALNLRMIPTLERFLRMLSFEPVLQGLAAGLLGSLPLVLAFAAFVVFCAHAWKARPKEMSLSAPAAGSASRA